MIVKQLSLFLVNKPGVLADVCQTLGDHHINIQGISISDTVDHAVVRLIVDDPNAAIHILGEHGVLVVENDVLGVEVDDHPGALAEVARQFARAKVNIEYAYGTSDSGKAKIFVRVCDVRKGKKVLAQGAPSAKKRRK